MGLLENGLRIKEFELLETHFSNLGNFGFGIDEHIDMGVKYEPTVGIFGFDMVVVLERPGFRVAKRREGKRKIGSRKHISKADAINWFLDSYDGVILHQNA